jgi:hypothetical protein
MKRRSGSALGGGGLSLLVTWASLALVTGCSSETTGGLPPLLTADGATPPPVAVAPTISPNLTPITFRPGRTLPPSRRRPFSPTYRIRRNLGRGVVLMSISRLHRSLTEWT